MYNFLIILLRVGSMYRPYKNVPAKCEGCLLCPCIVFNIKYLGILLANSHDAVSNISNWVCSQDELTEKYPKMLLFR